jgi:hypothetical protein
MGAFGVPDVLFAVFAEDGAGGRNKVGCVVESVVFFCFAGIFWFGFDDCTRDDVDV